MANELIVSSLNENLQMYSVYFIVCAKVAPRLKVTGSDVVTTESQWRSMTSSKYGRKNIGDAKVLR